MEQSKSSFQPTLGRTIALTGVVFAISLAVVSMTLLAILLIPQVFTVIFPSANPMLLP